MAPGFPTGRAFAIPGRSLAVAKEQEALARELRTTTSLARLPSLLLAPPTRPRRAVPNHPTLSKSRHPHFFRPTLIIVFAIFGSAAPLGVRIE